MSNMEKEDLAPVPMEALDIPLMTEEEAALAAKRKGKRKKRYAGTPVSFSITSLMDALTILLVFLLMNFAADPTNVTQNDDLRLVASTESMKPEKAIPVAITRKHILVNEQPVVAVQTGKVAGQFKRGGDDGFYIVPLAEKLQEEADRQAMIEKALAASSRDFKFKGRLMIVADRDVPFRLLSEVLYTAGQTQFGDFLFAVIAD